jgi:hypothetical protein
MKHLAPLLLVFLPFVASAAQFGAVGRPADLPQDANGRDAIHCEAVTTIYSDSPQQACLTAGQRMTAAANAEAAASQKATSERGLNASRGSANTAGDPPSR